MFRRGEMIEVNIEIILSGEIIEVNIEIILH